MAVILACVSASLAQDAPTTQPAAGRPPELLARLREAADQIHLTNEQKTQVLQLLGQTRQKLRELRQQAGDGDMRRQARDVVQASREQFMAILTPPQREQMLQFLQDVPPIAQPAPTTEPAEPPRVPAVVQVGQPAPDFTLKKLDGQTAQRSSLNGKIVLLVFGSYSSPSFRQRAAALEQIRRDYATRVTPLIVYTRETHAVSQWEVARNLREDVAVEQPADMDGRVALAKQARQALKLAVPIAVDTMDDATASAYGGFTNAAVLIGRDGTILARQQWFEPYAMREMLDQAIRVGQKAADNEQN